MADFAAQDLGSEMFLIEPFLPAGGKAILHGKRGHGKSALSLTMAQAVATGGSFLGSYPCTTPGPVVSIGIDMTVRLQQDRARRIAGAHPELRDRLFFCPSDNRIDVIEMAEDDPEWAAEVRSLRPALVIIDTLRNSHRLDENASETPGLVFDAWRRLVGPTAAMLFLHHDRKTFDSGSRDEDWRGAGAWFDEIDAGLHMIRSKKQGFRLEFSRVRTCDDQDPIPLTLDETSLLLRPSELPPVELEILRMMGQNAPRAEIIEMAMDHGRWNGSALSQATVYRRLEGYAP